MSSRYGKVICRKNYNDIFITIIRADSHYKFSLSTDIYFIFSTNKSSCLTASVEKDKKFAAISNSKDFLKLLKIMYRFSPRLG